MKEFTHKLMSLFLVLLVLGSTTSFSIDKHFCGDHLVDVAIFGKATPCKMETALIAKYDEEHTKAVDCCKDEIAVIEGQDELKIQFDPLDIKSNTLFQAVSYGYKNLPNEILIDFVPISGYPPPLIVADYQILYDQYLI